MFCPACRSEYPDDWKRCPKDEAALLRSQIIGKYRVDQIIGIGGMGAVYRAFNPDTHTTVALKLMHGHAATLDAARTRFQREAAAVAALRTRHVVSVLDFGADIDGTLYLVMEFLAGHPLRAEITDAPTMPMPRVNLVFDGALRGLGAAHRAGITHRDLKPENVFVADTDDGEVTKILDFGIARVKSQDAALTQSGALMGTPAYMAPEQVAGNRGQIGAWTDVYSMGVILYEMLTGVAPFSAPTITEVLSKVLSRDFPSLRKLRPELPEPVHDVVERAIADDPRERFPHADGLREAWAAAFGSFGTDVQGATVPRFRGAAPANQPDASQQTDWGSAPTVPPVRPLAGPATPGGGIAGNLPPRPQPLPGASNQSVTPGPVVVEQSQPLAPPRSRAGLYAAVGILVGGAAIATVVVMASSGAPSGAGAGSAISDAGSAAVTEVLADAAATVLTAPGPDDAAAEPPADMAFFAGGPIELGVDPARFRGFPDLDPVHTADVAPFWIDRHEVDADAFAGAAPRGAGKAAALPATNVDWTTARRFCEQHGKRLPTEAEWEVAARAGQLDPRGARLKAKGVTGPAPVGSHAGDCTPDGVCDLLGNVMEWTADPWRTGGKLDPRPGRRAIRGASYSVSPTQTWYASIHARVAAAEAAADPEIGFRCARSADASAAP